VSKAKAAKAPSAKKTTKKAASKSAKSDGRATVSDLKAEEHNRVEVELGGWPAGVTTYRIGETWICKIDNVSPGAVVARARGSTKNEAVDAATQSAARRLAATRLYSR
jgi:hypothetical protein